MGSENVLSHFSLHQNKRLVFTSKLLNNMTNGKDGLTFKFQQT
jgi:hypothetical protein